MNEVNNTSVHKRACKRLAITLIAVLAAAMTTLMSTVATTALATPKGIFAPFAQCPTSIPGVALCQYVEVTSGELTVGALRVPIDKTIVFQGGAIPTGSPNPNEYFLLPAANGESVSPTELDVPGGLRSIIGCRERDRDFFWRAHGHELCRGFSHGKAHNEVTATIEPVAGPTDPAILDFAAVIEEKGTALTFPARVHLKNPLLGEACFLGSETHPIVLRLTDGTTSPPPPNEPITGSIGKLAGEEEGGYESLKISEDTLVDNTFSVPPAEGCGGERRAPRIDALIDQTLGLESPAGHNTAILTGTHHAAAVQAVLASEKFPAQEETTPPPPHHHHHHWWWSQH